MQSPENDFTKNKDQIIRVIRMMGAVLLILGLSMMFIYNEQIVGFALTIMGIIEIVATPRVLEWLVSVRQRELQQKEKEINKE